VHLLEIKVQCIRSELIVDPTGVKVDKAFPLVVVCDDGNVPEAKPIIFLIDPKDAKTNCGVYAVVGSPVPVREYKPVVGLVYVPIVVGTEKYKN
jgi:hypothetical protein